MIKIRECLEKYKIEFYENFNIEKISSIKLGNGWGQTEISFNMQSAVDYESKMIVSVDINNKPTDHTQLEKQIENVEKHNWRNTTSNKCR